MKRLHKRPLTALTTALLTAAALVLFVGSVSAQTDAPAGALAAEGAVVNDVLGVTISAPEGWELVKVQGNDKSIANFRHPESQSQVEVIGTKLINNDVAKVFFDTFHSSLLSAEFVEAKGAVETTIGTMTGLQTEYRFEHTGIALRVVVFGFTHGDAAYLIIGYFKDDERDTYYPALKATVEGLLFT